MKTSKFFAFAFVFGIIALAGSVRPAEAVTPGYKCGMDRDDPECSKDCVRVVGLTNPETYLYEKVSTNAVPPRNCTGGATSDNCCTHEQPCGTKVIYNSALDCSLERNPRAPGPKPVNVTSCFTGKTAKGTTCN